MRGRLKTKILLFNTQHKKQGGIKKKNIFWGQGLRTFNWPLWRLVWCWVRWVCDRWRWPSPWGRGRWCRLGNYSKFTNFTLLLTGKCCKSELICQIRNRIIFIRIHTTVTTIQVPGTGITDVTHFTVVFYISVSSFLKLQNPLTKQKTLTFYKVLGISGIIAGLTSLGGER